MEASLKSDAIIKVEGLTQTYHSGDRHLTVLRDIRFSIPDAASVAVVGPSGSGKTTLLGLCAGLDRPAEGQVSLLGQDLNSMSEETRAQFRNRNIGFVFQNFQLIPTLTALENVMVPLELRGGKRVRHEAVDLLKRVGLKDRLDHFPIQLSGGEQQRVSLARAFINQPRILFADEPTGNLDTETSHRIADLLFELNHESGTVLVLVTHDVELSRRAGRIIRLNDGCIVSDTLSTRVGESTVKPVTVNSSGED